MYGLSREFGFPAIVRAEPWIARQESRTPRTLFRDTIIGSHQSTIPDTRAPKETFPAACTYLKDSAIGTSPQSSVLGSNYPSPPLRSCDYAYPSFVRSTVERRQYGDFQISVPLWEGHGTWCFPKIQVHARHPCSRLRGREWESSERRKNSHGVNK